MGQYAKAPTDRVTLTDSVERILDAHIEGGETIVVLRKKQLFSVIDKANGGWVVEDQAVTSFSMVDEYLKLKGLKMRVCVDGTNEYEMYSRQ